MAETKRADVLSYLKSANMVEISELIAEIEEKFGVTATAPVAVAAAGPADSAAGADEEKTEFDIMYNQGISYDGDILDLAVKGEIVQKMGSWFSYNDVKIGQGRENAKQYFMDNNDVREEIITHVKSFMGLDGSITEENGKS